jgi:hypothetical protein
MLAKIKDPGNVGKATLHLNKVVSMRIHANWSKPVPQNTESNLKISKISICLMISFIKQISFNGY